MEYRDKEFYGLSLLKHVKVLYLKLILMRRHFINRFIIVVEKNVNVKKKAFVLPAFIVKVIMLLYE